jgi:hypothetical protein
MVRRFVAMLALEQPAVVGLDDLVAALKIRVPQLENEIVGRPYAGDKAGASEAYIVSISGSHFAVAFVGQPAPQGTFDAALSYAADNWPDGGNRIETHQAHIVLSNLVLAKGFDEAVDAAGSVTLIAGILNSLAPTIGVYWANGEVILPSDSFEAMTQTLITGHPPVGAWINMCNRFDDAEAGQNEVGGVSTLGLDSFCGREIETVAPQDGLAKAHERVLAVTADILRNGPGLADNSVLKIGENEAITVNLADSGMFVHDQPVIRLTPEEPEIQADEPEAGPSSADSEPPLFNRRKRGKQFAT